MPPKVSIVLPTYNGEKYIKKSIESIINQSFEDWELIIVNDCSTDLTPKIVNDYASQDNRIKVINNVENKKLPESLNIGFRKSIGEYLTWTSDDNEYLPNALANMHQVLSNNSDCYMVCANMQIVDWSGKFLGNFEVSNLLWPNNSVGACFMYKREVYEKVGEYNAKLFLVEDYDYWIRVVRRFGTIKTINNILYLYRSHKESLTSKRKKSIKLQLCKLREIYIDDIIKEEINYKDVLCSIYYDFIENNYECEASNKIKELLPEVMCDKLPIENNKNYIVFGAGKYGEEIAEKLGAKVAYFVDNNIEIVGDKKFGIEIISFDKLIKIAGKYNILIAVSSEKVYGILTQLYQNNIREFCTCYIFRNLYK